MLKSKDWLIKELINHLDFSTKKTAFYPIIFIFNQILKIIFGYFWLLIEFLIIFEITMISLLILTIFSFI
jgi:hypothetical protein